MTRKVPRPSDVRSAAESALETAQAVASSAMRVPSASAQIAAQLPDLVENLAVATERLNTTIDRMERYMALAVPCSKRWTACCRNWKRLSRRATTFIEPCPAFRELRP